MKASLFSLMWTGLFVSSVSVMIAFGAEDPFQAGVRPTDPLTPQEQQKKFVVPPGYEIQLVVSEPDIPKPMNMAFDGAGRLWVTGSIEYPYAAADGKGRDVVKVIEDTDGDGAADKVVTFADGLNIPIGLYPYRDGVVCYSIPNIWFLRDTDGDGKADVREVLYGPLGNPRDTHGMQNAFRRGNDGWLYICHGFANDTTIRGKDGSEIRLNSGNSYRVRLDGSRVEQYTWGQVNPFGSTFTDVGDIITADCHSNPLTLLLRGGYYSSFGKPNDGLGFVPPIMEHSHGSTAICGAAFLNGPHFPGEWRGNLLVGNVMTSRVNRDELIYRGSTVSAKEASDFVSTTDPWFRPVDLQIGPDGSLYIADFYNRIIGHYEVPLEHPGRDKSRARIWRVARKGVSNRDGFDLKKATVDQLIATLSANVATRRSSAADELTDRIGIAADGPLRKVLGTTNDTNTLVLGRWLLHRLGTVNDDDYRHATSHQDRLVRINGYRMLSEAPEWNDARRDLAIAGLSDADPVVRRAAADALGQHPSNGVLDPLFAALGATSAEDIHLRHTLRMSIRNQLRVPGVFAKLQTASLTKEHRQILAEAAISISSEDAAAFVVDFLGRNLVVGANARPFFAHAAANVPVEQVAAICRDIQGRFSNDLDAQLELLTSIHQSLTKRGNAPPPAFVEWANELAKRLLSSVAEAGGQWKPEGPSNPWGTEKRNTADGAKNVTFYSSLPGGEYETGILRSRTFKIPAKLSFLLCGHLGFPNEPADEKNFVQLRLASGEVVAKTLAPRSDLAKRVTWDLSAHANQEGYIEVVDGLDLSAYAWLAVSGFDPPVITIPTLGPNQIAARQIAAATISTTLRSSNLKSEFHDLLMSSTADWRVRSACAKALTALEPNATRNALAEVISDTSLPEPLRVSACNLIGGESKDDPGELLSQVLKAATMKLQRQVAQRLGETPEGAGILIDQIEKGVAAGRILQDEGFRQKLLASKLPGLEERIGKQLASLPPANLLIQANIDSRRRAYVSATPSVEKGKELFTKHCAICHKAQGKGAIIGPQLDGISKRGVDRILEDVLDPARNVDVAFQTSVLSLNDGRVVTGLLRREEGKALILANSEGKEISVLQSDIEEHKKSPVSIMPANVAEIVPLDDFMDLLGYLKSL